MGIAQYIAENNPVINVPDLLNLHHGNPLGIPLIAQIIFIFLVAVVMLYFNYQIRHKGKSQYYPVLYSLFFVSLVSIYYYCFQSGLPEVQINMVGTVKSKAIIGWFCQPEFVGWPIAIVGLLLTVVVAYSVLIAVMQVVAQLTVEAKLVEGKKWKEWKGALAIFLAGVLVMGVCSYVPDYHIVASWALFILLVMLAVFVVVKMVLDAIRMHSVKWALLVGLTFFVGFVAALMIILDCFRGFLFFLLIFMIFFSHVKARKKQVKE